MSDVQPLPLPTLLNYQTRLPSFEGPLDVLLRLIERHQLEIADISLVQVTDQFLAFIEAMSDAPPEVIAEFTAVGTRLTLLKSRSLLPRPPVINEEDEANPGDLVRQLQAYKRLKDVATQLGKRRESGYASFGPHSDGPVAQPGKLTPTRLAHYEPSVLIRSLRRRLSTVPLAMQTIRQRRIVSIREMLDRIVELASSRPSFRFSKVVENSQSRSETATAFLAVLLMVRHRSLDATQDGLFGDIELARAATTAFDAGILDNADDEFLNEFPGA